jgi:hypothetical protein
MAQRSDLTSSDPVRATAGRSAGKATLPRLAAEARTSAGRTVGVVAAAIDCHRRQSGRVSGRHGCRPGAGCRLGRNDREEIAVRIHRHADIEDDAGDSRGSAGTAIAVILYVGHLHRVGTDNGGRAHGGWLRIGPMRGRIGRGTRIIEKIEGVVDAEGAACRDADAQPGIMAGRPPTIAKNVLAVSPV